MQIRETGKIIELDDLLLCPTRFDFFSDIRQQGGDVVSKSQHIGVPSRDSELLTAVPKDINRIGRIFFSELLQRREPALKPSARGAVDHGINAIKHQVSGMDHV